MPLLTRRKKTHRDMEDWNNSINQLDCIDNYSILHSKTPEHTFFSRVQMKTFTTEEHVLDVKVSKFK